MSSDEASATRIAILQACLELLEQGTAPSMSEIAARAGKSRQAVYLHFENRTALLLSAVEFARTSFGVVKAYEAILANEDAEAALGDLMALHASFTPRIINVSRALEAVRTQDADFDKAWRARDQGNRRSLVRGVLERLAAERRLADGWSLDAATDWLWALLAPSFMEDLQALGWPSERIGETTRLAALTLFRPEPRSTARLIHPSHGRAAKLARLSKLRTRT